MNSAGRENPRWSEDQSKLSDSKRDRNQVVTTDDRGGVGIRERSKRFADDEQSKTARSRAFLIQIFRLSGARSAPEVEKGGRS